MVFSYEESYGYMLGDFVRDKDAVTASLLLTEMAAYYYAKGMTVLDAYQALCDVLLLRNKLEPGKGIVALRPVAVCNRLRHLGGDDGLEGNRIFGQLAGALHGPQQGCSYRFPAAHGDGRVLLR